MRVGVRSSRYGMSAAGAVGIGSRVFGGARLGPVLTAADSSRRAIRLAITRELISLLTVCLRDGRQILYISIQSLQYIH